MKIFLNLLDLSKWSTANALMTLCPSTTRQSQYHSELWTDTEEIHTMTVARMSQTYKLDTGLRWV